MTISSAYFDVNSIQVPDCSVRTQVITGKRIMMGVSLANRRFTLPFMDALGGWIADWSAADLSVVIFDRCEATNYSVFRGLTEKQAIQRAVHRANELRRAFARRLATSLVPTTILLESELWDRNCAQIGPTYAAVSECYRNNPLFVSDVQKQVQLNVALRLEKGPKQDKKLLANLAAEYVLRELAVFDVVFRSGLADTEVYPGDPLFVKERMWRGDYTGLSRLAINGHAPWFVNISFLSSRKGADARTECLRTHVRKAAEHSR